jgi:hypothetical protein
MIEKATLPTDEIDAIIAAGIVARSLEKERRRLSGVASCFR